MDEAPPPEPAKPINRLKARPQCKRLLDDEQHKFASKLYLRAVMAPREIVKELKVKFGIDVTSTQLSEYAYRVGWTKRRKRNEKAAIVMAESQKAVLAQARQLTVQHKDFLDASARVGAKIIQRAEVFVDHAQDAKELSSAANAARTGAEIYRKAVGLESSEGSGNRPTINFNFATSAESPFARAKVVSTPLDDVRESREQREQEAIDIEPEGSDTPSPTPDDDQEEPLEDQPASS